MMGFAPAIDDVGANAVTTVTFVPNEGRDGWSEIQNGRPCGNICISILTRRKMKWRKICNQGRSAPGSSRSDRASDCLPVNGYSVFATRRAMRLDRGGVYRQSQAVLAAAGERFSRAGNLANARRLNDMSDRAEDALIVIARLHDRSLARAASYKPTDRR